MDRATLKVLRKLGCGLEKKHRTGEWRITLPDGSVVLASSTRKDAPGHVRRLIVKLRAKEKAQSATE